MIYTFTMILMMLLQKLLPMEALPLGENVIHGQALIQICTILPLENFAQESIRFAQMMERVLHWSVLREVNLRRCQGNILQ